jgi:2-oxoglutarate/2-oxoacid ferredoxin oxidoreductase subunit beta
MSMQKVFERPEALSNVPFAYCSGCLHSVVHRLIAELIDEMGVIDKTIGICPVGCAVFMYEYMECDMIEASHGRAPAVATGMKRVIPDSLIWTYQGDGDLAAIGTAETIHAAARGENITVIFINNGTYGMTGGQMAPTTMLGQKATTCQMGRQAAANGYPIKVCELLSTLDGPSYIARVAPVTPAGLTKTKAAIKKAFQKQLDCKGFSLVEVLSNCPTQWKMSPVESFKWIEETASDYYPLGEFIDR